MNGFCLLVELHREGSALQPAQQACLQNIPLSNGIIFHRLFYNWPLHINSVVFPPCSPLIFETFLKCGKLQCKSIFNRNEVRLVTIETNQIVSYLSGGYIKHLETTWYVSHVTWQVSHVTLKSQVVVIRFGSLKKSNLS